MNMKCILETLEPQTQSRSVLSHVVSCCLHLHLWQNCKRGEKSIVHVFNNLWKCRPCQAYVQCNEDNADRDIQTEEIEMCEKWTQHPPEHKGACGGERKPGYFSDEASVCMRTLITVFVLADPNLSQEAGDKTANEANFDSKHLTAFLRSASQVNFLIMHRLPTVWRFLWPKPMPAVFCVSIKVMVVLLEEDRAESKSLRKLRSQTDALSFSDGSLQLNTKLPFLYGTHTF